MSWQGEHQTLTKPSMKHHVFSEDTFNLTTSRSATNKHTSMGRHNDEVTEIVQGSRLQWL